MTNEMTTARGAWSFLLALALALSLVAAPAAADTAEQQVDATYDSFLEVTFNLADPAAFGQLVPGQNETSGGSLDVSTNIPWSATVEAVALRTFMDGADPGARGRMTLWDTAANAPFCANGNAVSPSNGCPSYVELDPDNRVRVNGVEVGGDVLSPQPYVGGSSATPAELGETTVELTIGANVPATAQLTETGQVYRARLLHTVAAG